jgi:hypothetical protein
MSVYNVHFIQILVIKSIKGTVKQYLTKDYIQCQSITQNKYVSWNRGAYLQFE